MTLSLVNRIRDIHDFAREHLSHLPRRSGESYFQHGLEVAQAVSEVSGDETLHAVALLHDAFVHPSGDLLISSSPLAPHEKILARQMHNLRRLHIDEKTSDLDTFITALTEDPRLLHLRMAHRLNDIRNLDRFKPDLRKQIAQETLHMYTSIAGRLGFNAWRYEMEDKCFRLLQPKISRNLQEQFKSFEVLDKMCLDHTRKYLAQELAESDIAAFIDGRIKGLYSTYQKMLLKNRKFEDVTDRLAIRVVVNTIEDCYRALGLIHALMHPIPGKLKDYIGAPKENGYQSIHTVVYPLPGVTEQPIEIQIRTWEIHRQCEYGITAHNNYKDAFYSMTSGLTKVDLFRNLEILRASARSPEQFETALRTYFREDHLLIFDEQNNLYHLKKPASVLDFVCTVHKQKTSRVKTVRLNGKVDSLDRQLKDGDVVEVIFTETHQLKKDWLMACHQESSKLMIKELLKTIS